MDTLPQEIQDIIYEYLPFEENVRLGNEYVARKLYKEKIHRAAMNGHIEVIKWLHINKKEGCKKSTMNYAAGCGFLQIVKWLHFNRKENGGRRWAFRCR